MKTKIIALLVVAVVICAASIGITVWSGIEGWGLTPKSYGVLVASFLLQAFVMACTNIVTKAITD